MKTKEKGFLAEKVAGEFLKKEGYQIVERNWKLRKFGEIDIIAKKKDLLNFVEVKALYEQRNFQPEIHFSKRKFKKLAALASFYANQSNFSRWIISLVAISFLGDDVKINYYENLQV